MSKASQQPKRTTTRCAIYTRKSTEEGLQQEFNTLDAQRESGQAYIAAQKHEGWTCLPDRYDDGGFTGGNMDRPALARLLSDIRDGRVDCVVVYKVDRLSRSLMDFSRIMETFDKHGVSFVSVTQQFNTTHSMGRLTLNILLSFAQFEREIISERTRDKIAAARRKGKFAGGKPILGYDLLSSPAGPKLVVNEDEAEQVRQIFQLYLAHEALVPTVTALETRGWGTKRYTCRNGKVVGGRGFDKTTLFRLLTNVTYLGKVQYKDEVHPGEHPAIVDAAVWQRVQAVLQRNGRTGGALMRNKHGALLKGILRCGSCGCSMGHTYTSKGTNRRYRYYVCLNAQKKGWHTCATKSVPAAEIEQFVIQQIKGIGKDPQVMAETMRQAVGEGQRELKALQGEERTLRRQLARYSKQLLGLAGAGDRSGTADRLAGVQDHIRQTEQRLTMIGDQVVSFQHQIVDEREVRAALTAFDPVWQTLSPRERARMVRLLVDRVEYDGKAGTVSVTFRPSGIKTLAQEQPTEVAA